MPVMHLYGSVSGECAGYEADLLQGSGLKVLGVSAQGTGM